MPFRYAGHSVSPKALAAQCFFCNFQLNGNHCGSWFAREGMTCRERDILLPTVRKISTPPLSGSILSVVGEHPAVFPSRSGSKRANELQTVIRRIKLIIKFKNIAL